MKPMDLTLLVTIFSLSLIVLLTRRGVVDALIETLRNFRGGPPSGMHPMPSDDRFLLLRRARRDRRT